MDTALALHTGHALAIILGNSSVSNAGRRCRISDARPRSLGCFSLLNLIGDLFGVHRGKDVCSRSRQ